MLPEVSGKISLESVNAIPSNNLFAISLILKLSSSTDFHLINSYSWQGSSQLTIGLPKVDTFDRLFVLESEMFNRYQIVLCKNR